MDAVREHPDQVQQDIMEIGEVLMREQPGASMAEVWEEALALYRVRFATEILPPADEERVE